MKLKLLSNGRPIARLAEALVKAGDARLEPGGLFARLRKRTPWVTRWRR